MTKFGDKTVLHVHVQVTRSFSQPLLIEETLRHFLAYFLGTRFLFLFYFIFKDQTK